VFLVGPPGTGKTVALNPVGEMLRKAQSVTLAPNDITKQGLLDTLYGAARAALIDGRPFDYHFLALHIAELSNFMSQYDAALAGLLTELFDCPPFNEEVKRGHDKGKFIPFPGISMIVGTATQNLGSTISDEMWGSGFMARVIMVYSADEIIPRDMFAEVPMDDGVAQELECALRRIGEMKGAMAWEEPARLALHSFRVNQKDGAPLHNRLTHYVTRRWLHLAKLCMIAALADERMVVGLEDFNTAVTWLSAAERDMPEIFKDMQTHEDGQIYEEFRSAMFQLHFNSQAAPIHISAMYKWLSTRAATHNIDRIIAISLAADLFRRVAGEDDLYMPQMPKGGKNLGVF